MRGAPSIRRFSANDDGAVAILTAVMGGMLIAAAAMAVDLGSIHLQSRKLQGIADLAAIAAARDLDHATTAAQATIDANHWPGVTAVVTTGRYQADRALAAKDRFRAGAGPANAARVELTAQTDLFFGGAILGKPTMTLRRKGVAARAQFAGFSIGTRLASLNGGAANALLSALTGGEVSLSVMDYNALADTRIDLFRYAEALRTSAHLEAGSFNDALSADVSTPQALSALGQLLTADGDARAGAAVTKIAVAAARVDARVEGLIDLGPIGDQSSVVSARATRFTVTALDLANAILLVAQEGRQVKLDLGAQIPGLTDVDVWLAIGERPNRTPWLAVDDDGGATVRTSQARLFIEAKALSALALVGAKPVTLPVFVELASGEAKIRSIACPGQASQNRVTLDVRPSLGKLAIGQVDRTELNDFKQDLPIGPASILDLGLVQAQASAEVRLGGDAWQRVEFTQADIDGGAIKSVRTGDLAQATLTSLLGRTQVTARVAGISSPALNTSLLGSLTTLGAPLDDLLNSLTDLLGVRLGEADVQVHGLRCRDAALVA